MTRTHNRNNLSIYSLLKKDNWKLLCSNGATGSRCHPRQRTQSKSLVGSKIRWAAYTGYDETDIETHQRQRRTHFIFHGIPPVWLPFCSCCTVCFNWLVCFGGPSRWTRQKSTNAGVSTEPHPVHYIFYADWQGGGRSNVTDWAGVLWRRKPAKAWVEKRRHGDLEITRRIKLPFQKVKPQKIYHAITLNFGKKRKLNYRVSKLIQRLSMIHIIYKCAQQKFSNKISQLTPNQCLSIIVLTPVTSFFNFEQI